MQTLLTLRMKHVLVSPLASETLPFASQAPANIPGVAQPVGKVPFQPATLPSPSWYDPALRVRVCDPPQVRDVGMAVPDGLVGVMFTLNEVIVSVVGAQTFVIVRLAG